MLNKVDIYSYFTGDELSELTLLDLCLRPSARLVNHWMPLLSYHSESYQCYDFDEDGSIGSNIDILKCGAPVYVPAIDPEDYLEASRLFELCEMACHKLWNHHHTYLNRRTKWLIPKLRVDMTKRPIESIKQELLFDI